MTTQILAVAPVRTFEIPGMNANEMETTMSPETITHEEIQDLVAELQAAGYGPGAIVCRIVHGEPQTGVYQRGMVTWLHKSQIAGRNYCPIEVRWLSAENRLESLWPSELMLLMEAVPEDTIKLLVDDWKSRQQT